MYNILKDKLQVHHRSSVKKVFLKAWQNSQENTSTGLSLSLKTLLKSHSSTGVFLWICEFFGTPILKNVWEQLLLRGFFLEVFRKFQKIFTGTNEKMILVYMVHNAILNESSHV